MRVAVVVGLIALPVAVGGLGIAAAVVAFGPAPVSSTADGNLTAASAASGSDWPDSQGGTAIEGSRPHLTVSDGTRTITLPGAIPAMLTLLPSPSSDLPPLAPEPVGQGGAAPDGSAPSAPAASPDPDRGPAGGQSVVGGQGSAGTLPPSFDGRAAGSTPGTADGPSRLTASPRPPGIDSHDSRATAGDSSPAIEAPRGMNPGRGDGRPDANRPGAGGPGASGPGTGGPGANRPPTHADDQGRPAHAGTNGRPPHASDNGNGNGNGNGRGNDRDDNRGDSGPDGSDHGGGRDGGRAPDDRSTPR